MLSLGESSDSAVKAEKEVEVNYGNRRSVDACYNNRLEEVTEDSCKEETPVEEDFIHLCKDATEAIAQWNGIEQQ